MQAFPLDRRGAFSMNMLETWNPSRLRPDRRRTIRSSDGGGIAAACIIEDVERLADRFR